MYDFLLPRLLKSLRTPRSSSPLNRHLVTNIALVQSLIERCDRPGTDRSDVLQRTPDRSGKRVTRSHKSGSMTVAERGETGRAGRKGGREGGWKGHRVLRRRNAPTRHFQNVT